MTTTARNMRLKHRSKEITEGPERAPARSYLWAMGLTQEDMDKPFVAVANLASDITPCNVHLDRLVLAAKEGIRQSDSTPFQFGTITVSDGISMGTEGMKVSLVSREVIADSIEVVAFGERMDALVTVAGCDKNMPGCLMAMARLNIPSLFIYGGTIMPGRFQGRDVNVQDVFEAVGAHATGEMSLEQLRELERQACPGEGSCAGLFTANTMSTAIEAMGMSLPRDASIPAIDPRKTEECGLAGTTIMRLLEQDLRPRDILTKAAFENAITVAVSMGGSTNVVLHLMAIAWEAGVDLSLDDFDRIGRSTPYIADMKPGGRYVMADLDRYGGVPLVMKRLLRAGLLHGDAITVTGRTIAENLESMDTIEDQPVVSTVDSPRSATGGLAILYGNLAPEGAVIKVAGSQERVYRGPARVFDQEGSRLSSHSKPAHPVRRRGSYPLRRPQGRSGHAGDAGRYQRSGWTGPGGRRSPDHRRPFFRRHSWSHGGARHPGGSGGRSHRPAPGGRHNYPGHPRTAPGRGSDPRGAGLPAGQLATIAAHVYHRRASQIRQVGILGLRGGGDPVKLNRQGLPRPLGRIMQTVPDTGLAHVRQAIVELLWTTGRKQSIVIGPLEEKSASPAKCRLRPWTTCPSPTPQAWPPCVWPSLKISPSLTI